MEPFMLCVGCLRCGGGGQFRLRDRWSLSFGFHHTAIEPTDADCVDFNRRISKAFELGPEGYISTLNPDEGWVQLNARGTRGPMIAPGSRRHRRQMDKSG